MNAMKKLRPIETPKPQDPYRKAQMGLLRHFDLSEPEFRELERERPRHLVVEGDSVLACSAHDGLTFRLSYAYPDRDAFARLFPAMLQRLLEADLEQADAPMGFRLTLTDAPSRPYLEPVLSAHAFELSREWIKMTLLELPKGGPSEDVAAGFVLRPARPDDAEAIAELDAAAFPTPSLTPRTVQIEGRSLLRVLEESTSGRAIGFLRLRADETGGGHISDVAVHPDWQRRGLGEAMLRWALGWFRGEGLRRASLTVSVGNAPAIALYRKLGFTTGERGLDYRRPIDEEEVRQVLEKHRAAHIRVRPR